MPPGEVAKIQVPNEYKEALTRGARDPVFFCRYFLDYEPHEGQRKWLTNSTKDENILSTGNRWGKSDIAAAKRIWKMAYKTGWPEYDPNKWYYSVNEIGKSTRLNSSHVRISYAVFCLKKKT